MGWPGDGDLTATLSVSIWRQRRASWTGSINGSLLKTMIVKAGRQEVI